MSDNKPLDDVRAKVRSGQTITVEEAELLLRTIDTLEKKNGLLSHHVLELTEELENVKMDFGGGNR